MGIVELDFAKGVASVYAHFICYGTAASEALSKNIADSIMHFWNEPAGKIWLDGEELLVQFVITGAHHPRLKPRDVIENDNPAFNFIRVEEFSNIDISFVDGLGSNTGYFKLLNLQNNSTTAAHEFGHMLGLPHPRHLDIRGFGQPGIMYPRGTITDPGFQYDPLARPGEVGGTLNPEHRRVLPSDVGQLRLADLPFNKDGIAIIGNFSSVWHDKH